MEKQCEDKKMRNNAKEYGTIIQIQAQSIITRQMQCNTECVVHIEAINMEINNATNYNLKWMPTNWQLQ